MKYSEIQYKIHIEAPPPARMWRGVRRSLWAPTRLIFKSGRLIFLSRHGLWSVPLRSDLRLKNGVRSRGRLEGRHCPHRHLTTAIETKYVYFIPIYVPIYVPIMYIFGFALRVRDAGELNSKSSGVLWGDGGDSCALH